jgi:hypothetical protein
MHTTVILQSYSRSKAPCKVPGASLVAMQRLQCYLSEGSAIELNKHYFPRLQVSLPFSPLFVSSLASSPATMLDASKSRRHHGRTCPATCWAKSGCLLVIEASSIVTGKVRIQSGEQRREGCIEGISVRSVPWRNFLKDSIAIVALPPT